MGNTSSERFVDRSDEDLWWSNAGRADPSRVEREADVREPSRREFSDGDEFQLELARIRERRRDIIGRKRKEMEDLRSEVERLKLDNERLRRCSANERDAPVETPDQETEFLRRQNNELRKLLEEKSRLLQESEKVIGTNRELRVSIAELQEDLQHLNTEVVNFEKEREDYRAHVVALKDVISVSKHMLQIRESQLKELKQKIDNIESSLSDHEAQVMSQDLRKEYEKQLANIRSLRQLYEERQRMERREKEDLKSKMDDMKKEMEEEQKRNSELQERISELETDSSTKYDTIKTLESNLGLSKAESRQYKSELSVINQLFSEILLGFNSSQDIDLDRLQKHLEDHHDLLQAIVVNEISSEVSYALPKVLLDLLNQVNGEENNKAAEDTPSQVMGSDDLKLEIEEQQESTSSIHQQMNSAEEIVANLPKVWRVLIELLSHQTAPTNTLSTSDDKEHPCYKTVDTPKGPSPVLSVSRTFIRLKDLILEKKSLEKETNHLKQLNGHLENRLQDQEKRLEMVHSELSKTWLVVGTLQKQHQMLHTQEKILRYELAQKRKLLNELKEELEDSREKWAQAREKNSNTEQQWRLLRTEFSARKTAVLSEEYNNSGESGYSDDREGLSSDEEPGYETDISEGAQKIAGSEISKISELEVLRGIVEDGASLLQTRGSKSAQKTAGSENCGSEKCDISELELLREMVEDGANLDQTLCSEMRAGPSSGSTGIVTDTGDLFLDNVVDDGSQKINVLVSQNEHLTSLISPDSDRLLLSDLEENSEISKNTGDVTDTLQKLPNSTESRESLAECTQKITDGGNAVDRLKLNDFQENSEICKNTLQKSLDSTETKEIPLECTQKITVEGNTEVEPLSCSTAISDEGCFTINDEIGENTQKNTCCFHDMSVVEEPVNMAEGTSYAESQQECAQKIRSKKETNDSVSSEMEIRCVEEHSCEMVNPKRHDNNEKMKRRTTDCTQKITSSFEDMSEDNNNQSVSSEKQICCVEEYPCELETSRQDESVSQKITSDCDRLTESLSEISSSSKERMEKVELNCGDLVQGVPTTSEESVPSSSAGQKLTLEEVLAKRDERLRRLEGQASQLVSKVTNTAIRSVAISTRLDDLHEVYGQNEENNGSDDSVPNENSQDIE